MWSERVSRSTLSYFIWKQRVSEQIDARVWGLSSSETVPGGSRRETE